MRQLLRVVGGPQTSTFASVTQARLALGSLSLGERRDVLVLTRLAMPPAILRHREMVLPPSGASPASLPACLEYLEATLTFGDVCCRHCNRWIRRYCLSPVVRSNSVSLPALSAARAMFLHATTRHLLRCVPSQVCRQVSERVPQRADFPRGAFGCAAIRP